ncbi:hypothetical protein GQ607_016866 [Colletotrichum asianum]|uniref:Uncharacterized protein n=1 Tax=Colletotrichum asianum TaxID=702518 RepID=A0A8H3W078_9PEZI|nr:hypothetical protein GQ607_016866 [Colletotrichum asianum]
MLTILTLDTRAILVVREKHK